MKVITVESAYHSITFSLFSTIDDVCLATGKIDRIGLLNGFFTLSYQGESVKEDVNYETHLDAVKGILELLQSLNLLTSFQELQAIGHKILRGTCFYEKPIIIDDSFLNELEELKDLRSLPVMGEVLGIKAFQEVFPEVSSIAVFDSSFYKDLPEENYLYAVPYHWYHDFGVRKYGYHGLSHSYVNSQMKSLLGKEEYRLISCHLGESVSISAVKDGKCIDTSMGFSPLSGAIMSYRSGDIDSSIIPYIMQKEGKSASEVIVDLNHNSGLLGLSEFSSEIEDILHQSMEGNEKAVLAKNKYIRSIVNYISNYYVLLNGIDAIAFTGEIGEKSVSLRREICEKLSCLGVKMNLDKNSDSLLCAPIQSEDSDVDIYIIPHDRHLLIWKAMKDLLNR